MTMTKTKTAGIAVGALAIVIAAGAAWARGPGRGFMGTQMINTRVAQLEDAVNATPQQRQAIEKSRDNIIAALQANRQAGGHQQLMQLLTSDNLTADHPVHCSSGRRKFLHQPDPAFGGAVDLRQDLKSQRE